MTDKPVTTPVAGGRPETVAFPLGAWVRANTFGLALAFGLFALIGGTIEAMGAGHDSAARNLPALLAMAVAGSALALLRRRALGTHHTGPGWQLPLIGLLPPAGFLLGLGAAPFDFTMALLLTGTVGGALQLRALRPVGARSLLAGAGTWLVAALAATITVIVVMDGILGGLVGLDFEAIDADPGAASALLFAASFTIIGLVGGAVGGALEGATIRRRLRRDREGPPR
jgi:hypothetical protein